MKKKQMVILVAVLAALAVVYGVLSFVNKKAEEEEKAQEESQVVQVTDLEEIVSFSYEAPEQEALHFEKKKDDWVCVDDEKIELEQTYPNEIVNAFSSLTASRKMEELDALEDYGLAKPAYTVTLQPKDGKEVTVCIGDAVGEEYYLQVKGEDAVYTVASSVTGVLGHSLEDMKKVEDEEDAEADS